MYEAALPRLGQKTWIDAECEGSQMSYDEGENLETKRIEHVKADLI